MVSDTFLEQRNILSRGLDHWLELFEQEFTYLETPLPDRPRDAVFMLLRHGALAIHFGDKPVDVSKPANHVRAEWFHILYDAVRHWYVARFGAEAMRSKGNAPLEGVVMVRGVPFRLAVRAHRGKVEQEGKTAWMYFDDGVTPEEDPLAWIVGGPDLSKLDEASQEAVARDARNVADTLRFVEFRRVTANSIGDEEVPKLVVATSTYLQQAARRIVSGAERERGPAWFDLQMAVESALKSVVRHATGRQPITHRLLDLVRAARFHGVDLDDAVVAEWPEPKDIIEWRYGQGDPWSLRWLHEAYRSALAIARASMVQMPITIQPGFGILLEYPNFLREFE